MSNTRTQASVSNGTENRKKKLYGFFSEQQELQTGRAFVYRNPNNKLVVVTEVSTSPRHPEFWPDYESVGEVDSFVTTAPPE